MFANAASSSLSVLAVNTTIRFPSELAQFPFALPLFVIAGLDPAIQLLTKKMDPRVTMTGVQFKPIGIRSR